MAIFKDAGTKDSSRQKSQRSYESGAARSPSGSASSRSGTALEAVSYTHLTLPTILRV